MKIVSLLLKIVFCWIYIPYLLLKMIFGGSSSSSSASVASSSSSTSGGSGGIPMVTLKKGYDSNTYELGEIKMVGKDVQVQYKIQGQSFQRVIVNKGQSQKGPLLVNWSKRIVG